MSSANNDDDYQQQQQGDDEEVVVVDPNAPWAYVKFETSIVSVLLVCF